MKPVLRLFCVFLLLPTASAMADVFTYTATLNGASEAPTPTPSTATGFITVTLDGNMLTVVESFSGLIGGVATGAHIHCCAAPGATAAIEVPFTSFPATTSGLYTHTFDLSTLTYTPPGFTTATLVAGLNSGLAYANIHDATYPGGEIRGQLALVATPEPSSLFLLGTGLLGSVGMLRRRLM